MRRRQILWQRATTTRQVVAWQVSILGGCGLLGMGGLLALGGWHESAVAQSAVTQSAVGSPPSAAEPAEPQAGSLSQPQATDKPPAADEPVAKVASDRQVALEQKFAEALAGVELVGFFTDTNARPDKLHEERYGITSVTKIKDDLWLFNCRIQYGKNDAVLPLPLRVVWADDTPVITLTDFNVPGFGTFTARVMIYEGRYAGTWQGAKHGGHLFGRIERVEKDR